ncbi:MAG: TonB family protein [Deltaproteobacteria bacterium]|jgi:TonB family protein|nr:TonB family protein [Deltaproteobacteria bacterium]
MNAKPSAPSANGEPSRRPRPTRQNPFVEKRTRRRQTARARAMAHVRVPIHGEFHRHREQRHIPGWLRAGIGIAVLLASAGLHVAFVVMAFGVGSLGAQRAQERELLAIEMREREAKPKESEPEKEPEPPKPEPERAAVVKAPPAPKIEEPPKEPEKKPPPRIVGLSFESTVGEGDGEGPAFAVGNTRLGETAEFAAKKEDVPKERPGPVAGTEKPTTANQAATRIPRKGVTFTEAKYRGAPRKPAYPPTLKAQGVEADVEVLVFIDATGKVTNVKLLHESPYPEFNEAARQAALAQEWQPATRNGEPMASTKKYSYRFRLTDD